MHEFYCTLTRFLYSRPLPIERAEADFREFESDDQDSISNFYEDEAEDDYESYEDKDRIDDAASQPLIFDLVVGADLSSSQGE